MVAMNAGPNPERDQPTGPTRLRRAFTLPRNTLARRAPDDPHPADELPPKQLQVFRRPSIRRFISKIAQHLNGTRDEARVPPLGAACYQTWAPGQTPGVTGLKNQGNTCFINAVLQCISHTDQLAEYFVLDRYRADLMSRRNKLNAKKYGTRGEVTEQLAVLLKALWACQYSPELSTLFKQAVERHGAQYRGSQQHDALEFLQWLLDKVHEDLNQASKRKFKSVKTSGRPDEVIAAETLENYKRCNNSFIQGIFQAQYRSSLTCSRCRTQSNTFDPFQCISVQLPQFHKQYLYITVVYQSQQPRQVRIGMSVPSGATVAELRALLESDTGVARSHMLLTEIGDGDSCFRRTFTDTQSVGVISEADPVYCIEVPRLKDLLVTPTTDGSGYMLLCWVNVETESGRRFGSPYTMQVPRDVSYEDLQKLVLKEMSGTLHDDVLTASQPSGVFKMRIVDPSVDIEAGERPAFLSQGVEHPLYMEAVDGALTLGGPPTHLKLVMEWPADVKKGLIADDHDSVEEHATVRQLQEQAMHGGAPLTLDECLRDYTEAETLTDAWRCPRCQQYQPVIKTLDVWSLPEILIVHLKRFRQQTFRGCTSSTKLTTMVEFPVRGLDMSPHLAASRRLAAESSGESGGNGGEMIVPPPPPSGVGNWSPWRSRNGNGRQSPPGFDNLYDLYAVCYHHGTDLETGHYTAACRNPYDGRWYLYDDSKVTELSKQDSPEEEEGDEDSVASLLVNNSAYILFYQRRRQGSSSSTASTSSVGSGDNATPHWASRMPRFQPPKNLKAVSVPGPTGTASTATTTTTTIATSTDTSTGTNTTANAAKATSKPVGDDPSVEKHESDGGMASSPSPQPPVSEEEVVAWRNSQNALHSSQGSVGNRISSATSVSVTVPVPVPVPSSETSLADREVTTAVPAVVSGSALEEENKPQLYTTSIYINASSHNTNSNSTAGKDVPSQPATATATYTTTASVHRPRYSTWGSPGRTRGIQGPIGPL